MRKIKRYKLLVIYCMILVLNITNYNSLNGTEDTLHSTTITNGVDIRTNRELLEIKDTLSLDGTGTEIDPIIFSNYILEDNRMENVPLFLGSTSLHFIIDNCTFIGGNVTKYSYSNRVVLQNCTNVQIRNSIFINSLLWVLQSNNTIVTGNEFGKKEVEQSSVWIYESNNTIVKNNSINNTNKGIKLYNVNNYEIISNKLTDVISSIIIEEGRNGLIISNKIFNCTDGIQIRKNNNSFIFDNTINQSRFIAISIQTLSYNNKVTFNNIIKCDDHRPIYTTKDKNNIVNKNHYFPYNFWDTPVTDNNLDGIIDSPLGFRDDTSDQFHLLDPSPLVGRVIAGTSSPYIWLNTEFVDIENKTSLNYISSINWSKSLNYYNYTIEYNLKISETTSKQEQFVENINQTESNYKLNETNLDEGLYEIELSTYVNGEMKITITREFIIVSSRETTSSNMIMILISLIILGVLFSRKRKI